MVSRHLTTPMRQAVASTVVFVVFAVVLRYTWGAFDPEMRSWSLLGAAPVLGVLTYLQASKRESTVATFFIALGGGGLAFWTAVLLSGTFPVTRADVSWVLIIFAFPLACLGLGIQKRRNLRRTGPSQSA